MSRFPSGSLPQASGPLVIGLGLALVLGCRQRPPAATAPSPEDSVAVGYGVQSRAQTGDAVRTITAEELGTIKVKRVEQLLAGRVAGVHVYATPNGGFAVRIRGTSTFMGRSDPLYVVDGLPVDVEEGRGLSFLDPADIARIDILKDPAETSMYGVRGANGVVLITTKKR